MSDIDRPVTRRELREELTGLSTQLRAELVMQLRSEFVTKAVFREELAALTMQLRAEFATKADLHDSLQEVRAEMATGFAEMREYVELSVKSSRDELRTHFDVVAESFRSEFRNLYDWTLATTTSLAARVERLENRDASGASGSNG